MPSYARFMEMLGEAFRVIHFDKRGIGLSDRTATPDLETRMEDVRAVLDAAGSERAVLLGEGTDGGGLAAMYAATFPEDAGEHELKGVPDRWHLYRVVA